MGSTPPRPYGWRVTLTNGDTIHEFPKQGPLNRWDDLDLDAIETLALVDTGLVREAEPIVRWRLEDAALWIRGHEVDIQLGPVRPTRSPGRLIEPIQKKKAASTYRPGQGSSQQLLGFRVGCRRRLDELDGAPVGVVTKVTPEGQVGLRIDAPEALAGCGIAPIVDGRMVHSRDRFRELIAPPAGGPDPCP